MTSSSGSTPLALAPSYLGAKSIEPVFPKPSKSVEPAVDLLKASGLDRIEPARTVNTRDRKPALPKYPEMLRHGGLSYAELALDCDHDIAGSMLTVGEQFQDAPSYGFTQNVKCVHQQPVVPSLSPV
jgi:hypothetical protein